MNTTQLQNIFTYTGIMLLDNNLAMTSPEYFEEKSMKFFGKLGKSEFIQFPKLKYKYKTDENFLKNYDGFHENFWLEYCKLWNIKSDNYELMNNLNFLLNVFPPHREMKTNITINNFEKYIGNIESVTNVELSYMVHPVLMEYIINNLNLNDRYCKLRMLENI